MSAEALKLIIDSLNQEPFNLNTTLIAFDNFSDNRLLQVLSDVICWITGNDNIDVRDESPDATALRLFNSLKLLRFRPPTDIEQLDEWRVGIVEGSKASVYPVLYYIFSNVDALKERAYLAKFLTKVDVPSDIHDIDTVQLQNEHAEAMERFKEAHQQVTELRGDTMMVDDIKTDLRAMEQEKEQLTRRVEKIQRKVVNMPNLDKIIGAAEAHRKELERLENLNVQRQEQRNAVINSELKTQRLEAQLKEIRQQAEGLDPSDLVAQLEEEMKTNHFLLEKQEQEIRNRREMVKELQRISEMPAIEKSEVDQLKKDVDTINQRIIELESERDKREEGQDENFSIYRHQAATVERKRNGVAQQLQEAKNDLDEIQRRLAQRKEEMRSDNGGEDVVTSLQFKNYVNKLRGITIQYKKRRGEMEDIKSENLILNRTCELLTKKYEDLKDKMESMGMVVLENIEVPMRIERPKTAAPKTDDTEELRNMINDLNQQLDEKRARIAPLKDRREDVARKLNLTLEEFQTKKRRYDQEKHAMEEHFAALMKQVEDLEARYEHASTQGKMAELAGDTAEAHIAKITDGSINQVIEEIEQLTKKYQQDADAGRRGSAQVNTIDTKKQMLMWRSLEKIFEMKLALAKQDPAKSDYPIGDRRGGRF
ncbi:unnamed protein product, partial [Mesorhabditis spiculigera]